MNTIQKFLLPLQSEDEEEEEKSVVKFNNEVIEIISPDEFSEEIFEDKTDEIILEKRNSEERREEILKELHLLFEENKGETRNQRRLSMKGIKSLLFDDSIQNDSEKFQNLSSFKGVGLKIDDKKSDENLLEIATFFENNNEVNIKKERRNSLNILEKRNTISAQRRHSIAKSFIFNDLKIKEAIENTRKQFNNESLYISELINCSESSESFHSTLDSIEEKNTALNAQSISSITSSNQSPEFYIKKKRRSRRKSIRRENIGLYTLSLADDEFKIEDFDPTDFFYKNSMNDSSTSSSSGSNKYTKQLKRQHSILKYFGRKSSEADVYPLNISSISSAEKREIRSALGMTIDDIDSKASGLSLESKIKSRDSIESELDGYKLKDPLDESYELSNIRKEMDNEEKAVPFKRLSSLYIHTESNIENSFPKRQLAEFEIKQVSRDRWYGYINLKQNFLKKEGGPQGRRDNELIIGPCQCDSICRDLCSSIAPPLWMSKLERRLCRICQDKFNFFETPHHCRNCGSVVCSKCSDKFWPSSMIPSTYHNKEKMVRVCHSCHYLTERFVCALKDGDFDSVLKIFDSGNINLHTPYSVYKSKGFPIHIAASGGNVEILKWLLEEKRCSVYDSVTKKPLKTSSGLSVLAVASCKGNVEAIRYLIHNCHCHVSDITDPILLQRVLHIVIRAPGSIPSLSKCKFYHKIESDDLLFGAFSRKINIDFSNNALIKQFKDNYEEMKEYSSDIIGKGKEDYISNFSSLPHNCLTTASYSSKALRGKKNAYMSPRAIILIEDWLKKLTRSLANPNLDVFISNDQVDQQQMEGKVDIIENVTFDNLISVPSSLSFGSSLFS